MSESQGLLTLLEIHFRLSPLSANLPFSTQRVTLLPTLLGKAKLSEHNSHELPSPVPLLRCRLPAEAGVDPTPDSTPATLSHSSSILPFSIASFLCPTSPTCCAELLSHVQLFLTPWTVACQAPLFMEFSSQEYWSGQPFPSPGDLPNPGIQPRSPELQADSLWSESPGI